jgi:regulator of sigma E protease
MIITILATLLVLGVLIFFHELGHFLAAKLVGITVERFSIGFPPILYKKKIGETEYSIGLPYGGFVKMKGDIDDFGKDDGKTTEQTVHEPDSFFGKGPGKRAIVISGGVIFNILLGFLLFFTVSFFWGVGEPVDSPLVGSIVPTRPAEKLGLLPGDSIMAVNDVPVATWNDLSKILHSLPEQSVSVRWMHEGTIKEDTITTISQILPGDTIRIGLLGIGPPTKTVRIGFAESVSISARQTVMVYTEMLRMLIRLFSGRADVKEIGGPVMIAKMAGQSARMGFSNLLIFMAFISLNLALINMLPFPALDGGHLVFLALEAIRGKRLSHKAQLVFQNIGIFVLLSLIVLITAKDFISLFM